MPDLKFSHMHGPGLAKALHHPPSLGLCLPRARNKIVTEARITVSLHEACLRELREEAIMATTTTMARCREIGSIRGLSITLALRKARGSTFPEVGLCHSQPRVLLIKINNMAAERKGRRHVAVTVQSSDAGKPNSEAPHQVHAGGRDVLTSHLSSYSLREPGTSNFFTQNGSTWVLPFLPLAQDRNLGTILNSPLSANPPASASYQVRSSFLRLSISNTLTSVPTLF